MGIDVLLMDEFGGKIEDYPDPMGLILPMIPPEDDPAYPFLASIDPNGNTVFNRFQMKRFLTEWDYVVAQARGDSEKEIAEVVQRMASRCQREAHTYLKFVGD